MEQIWTHVAERISNPEVLFGLAVRFFGVFIVLIIVMIVLQVSGWVFQRLERKAQEATAPASPTPQARPADTTPASPGTTVPDEVAISIALAMVPDEIAVAIGLALTEAVEERGSVSLLSARGTTHAGWERPGSAWKLVGRQQALFRKTSLSRDITPKGE